MYYHLGRAGKALRKVGVVEFATTVAPGVRDVLLTGKASRRSVAATGQQYAYDAVVVDAPPTGRIARFLNVNAEVAGLAKVGPIRRRPTPSWACCVRRRTCCPHRDAARGDAGSGDAGRCRRAAPPRPAGRRSDRQPDAAARRSRCRAGSGRTGALDARRDRRRH